MATQRPVTAMLPQSSWRRLKYMGETRQNPAVQLSTLFRVKRTISVVPSTIAAMVMPEKAFPSKTASSRNEGSTMPPPAARLAFGVPPPVVISGADTPWLRMFRILLSELTAETAASASVLAFVTSLFRIEGALAVAKLTPGTTRIPARKLPGLTGQVKVFPVIRQSLDWPVANTPAPNGCVLR